MAKKGKPPSPYRSWLEHDLHKGVMNHCEHEPTNSHVPYTIHKKYIPDFVDPKKPNILYEAKGRFRTYEEAKKYIHIRESNPNIEIRFILMSANTRAYPQTKMSMGDWLDKHNFKWCLACQVPKDF